MTTATAGQLLTPERLRAWYRCTEFWHFGGEIERTPILEFIRLSIARITVTLLRNPDSDPISLVSRHVSGVIKRHEKSKTQMDQTVDEWINWTQTLVGRFLREEWPYGRWLPIAGPLTYRILISKTPIEIKISSVWRNRTLATPQPLYISYAASRHEMINDPLLWLAALTTQSKVKSVDKRVLQLGPKAPLHVFRPRIDSLSWDYQPITADTIPDKFVDQLIKNIEAMESGYHQPILPCGYTTCKYRDQCSPIGPLYQDDE